MPSRHGVAIMGIERCGRFHRYVYDVPTCDLHSRVAPQQDNSYESSDSEELSDE